MSDLEKNNLEEEYHFNEEETDIAPFDDLHSQQSGENHESVPKKTINFAEISKLFEKVNIKPILDLLKHNTLLRIGLIVFLLLMLTTFVYKCSSHPLVEKTNEKPLTNPVIHSSLKSQTIAPRPIPIVGTQPKSLPTYTQGGMNESQFLRLEKLNTDLQTQIKDLASQMKNLQSNVDATTENLKLASEQIIQMANKIGNTSHQNIARQQSKLKKMSSFSLPNQTKETVSKLQCALQAIIPGRAWLNCSNGETLTVRQGTKIINYGVVRYIDAASGRVLTSSGQIITFSQEDS